MGHPLPSLAPRLGALTLATMRPSTPAAYIARHHQRLVMRVVGDHARRLAARIADYLDLGHGPRIEHETVTAAIRADHQSPFFSQPPGLFHVRRYAEVHRRDDEGNPPPPPRCLSRTGSIRHDTFITIGGDETIDLSQKQLRPQ